MNSQGFTIRVYGLLTKPPDLVLVTDELRFGTAMTKFPGGGLELGEGTRTCLEREFMEELGVKISTLEHFYTTDYYQETALTTKPMQLISIYYFVESDQTEGIKTVEQAFAFESHQEGEQVFRWISIRDAHPSEITFPIDKLVFEMLKERY